MGTIGRIIERDALDDAPGPRGFLTVDVADAWLADRMTVEVVIPPLLACGRCEGGGCDGCDRSGAIRVTGDDAARTIQLTLPPAPARVRLVRPLGGDALEQLTIDVRVGATPSPWCRALDAPPRSAVLNPATMFVVLGVLVAAAIALAAAAAAAAAAR